MLHPLGMETSGTELGFERLVELIFKRHEFRVQREQVLRAEQRPHSIRVDLLLTSGDVRTVVEVKALRTKAPNPSDLRRAADFLLHARAALGADHALLVVNLRREQVPITALWSDVLVLGLDDLIDLAGDDLNLLSQLAEVERELNSALGEFDRPADLVSAGRPTDVSRLHLRASAPPPPPPLPPLEGQALCAELMEIIPGKAVRQTLASGRKGVNWRLFEEVAYESLIYIFKDLLGKWKEQESVAGDGNRFDALAKIQGDDVFCRTLVEDFRTRYILFEFKNHKGPIKANLVYITEKYLFPTALRSTAIIVSPQGFSGEADNAAKGALRDANKLVLSMTVERLCELLDDKDHGISPALKMEELLDAFLQSLGR